jgi:predicted SAM-dependent methyltransferase
MRNFVKKYFKSVKKNFSKIERFKNNAMPLFDNRRGIEIGGPSQLFINKLPVYKFAKSIDGCNFSNATVWEGSIVEGNNYKYIEGKKGYQFIKEASDLNGIANSSYDFLLSSHCLEHCANAIKTLKEWKGVLKAGATLLLVLPDHRFTFDHKRSITTFQHLLDDFAKKIDEHDLTHLDEILHLHDLSMDLPAGDFISFRNRSLKNFENRCLHHHVFNFALLEQLFEFCNIEVVDTCFIPPLHQVIIGKNQ